MAMSVAVAAGLLMAGAPVLAAEIRVLNWQGYGTSEAWALEMFTKKTEIDVVHDYFNSEQEMMTKLSDENAVITDWLMVLTSRQRNRGFQPCFLYLRNVKGLSYDFPSLSAKI